MLSEVGQSKLVKNSGLLSITLSNTFRVVYIHLAPIGHGGLARH